MKIQKKIFYYLLVLVILLQITSPIVFAANSTKQIYLALGDSIAEGYALTSAQTERYSYIVAQDKSYSEKNLAQSGMTCKEFYENLVSNDEYKTAIQNADVITISIGSNELLGTAIEIIKTATGVTTEDTNEKTIATATEKFKSATVPEKIAMLQAIAQGFNSADTKNKLDAGVQQYTTYWEKSVDEINKLKKSNATIVVTEFYNPYPLGKLSDLVNSFSPIDLTNMAELGDLADKDLGKLFDTYIEQMNTILSQKSNNEEYYKIAKIKDTFDTHNLFGEPKYTNVNLTPSDLNLDPHPNTKGHQEIATQILPYLKNSNTSQNSTDSDNKQDNTKQNDTKQDDTKQDDTKQDDTKQDNNKQDDNEQTTDNQDDKKQDTSEQDNNTQEGKITASDSNSSNNSSTTNDSTTSKKDSSSKNDSTIADGKLPQTGITYASLSLVLIAAIIGFYSFIMYKKHKDII